MVGKMYRLSKSVRAVYSDSVEKGFVLLPEGAVLQVQGLRDSTRVMQVKWQERDLFVFVEDVLERGVEMADSGERKHQAKA